MEESLRCLTCPHWNTKNNPGVRTPRAEWFLCEKHLVYTPDYLNCLDLEQLLTEVTDDGEI